MRQNQGLENPLSRERGDRDEGRKEGKRSWQGTTKKIKTMERSRKKPFQESFFSSTELSRL
jgi:hypothetical protein